ncbi:MAG: DNA polymerase I [Calditrichia bacterium]
METKERVFLIDGTALFYRSYFAFIRNPLINSKGENTGALYGVANSLMKILLEEKPDYIGVVFDSKEPTFRHQMYKEYKATREKMPEEMVDQLPRVLELIQAFNIPTIEKPGYEADDLIATLAKKAEERQMECLMVTGDKDFMQLITANIKMYVVRPGKDREIFDLQYLKEKYEMTPEQVIDFLALMGDSSDNIPGVKGVGEKTARDLLKRFVSLDNIYQNLDKIDKPALRQKLLEGRESAYLSKQLVKIDSRVPLDLDFKELKSGPPNQQELTRMFEALEFYSLMDRLKELSGAESVRVESMQKAERDYRLVHSRKDLSDLARLLTESKFFVFDTETTGLDVFDSEIIGIAFSVKPFQAFYVPLNDSTSEFSAEEAWQILSPIFEEEKIKKGGQNIKFDGLMLGQHHIQLRGIQFDTMIAHYLLYPGTRQHNLDNMASKYLNYQMIPIEDLIGPRGKKQKNMKDIPVEKVYVYACEDADVTFRLKEILERKLRDTQTFELFQEVEMPLVAVLMQMEKNGVKLDVPFLKQMSEELGKDLQHLEKEIYQLAGCEFNINSPQQLGKVLFDTLEIQKDLNSRKPGRTPTGQYSTSESVLERYSEHPVVGKILEYRKLMKLKSTYVDALPALISKRTGRLHTSFNQTVAATGRLSSSDPNLQNIPIRTEIGSKIRRSFIPENPEDFILSADYSQIELRIMAHLAGDSGLKEAFLRGEDVHATTAAAIFNIPLEMVNPDQRRKAKEVNFGIIYGISPYGLANRLKISPEEAKEIIDNYFIRFPRVNDYMIHTIASAHRDKYVTTILNRRRYLPEIESSNQTVRQNAERAAINTTIQGSAADLIKLAMIKIQKRLDGENLNSKMILQVHDELVFEVMAKEVDYLKRMIKNEMENAIKLSVPIKVDIGVGKNWLEAH